MESAGQLISKLIRPKGRPGCIVDEGASADTDFVKADLPEDFFEVHPRLSAVYGKPTIYNPFRTAITVGPTSFAERYQIEERPEPPRLMVGEVYAVGKPLIQRVTLEECRLLPGSYYISPDARTLYVNFPLFAKQNVELAVREQVFVPAFRGGSGRRGAKKEVARAKTKQKVFEITMPEGITQLFVQMLLAAAGEKGYKINYDQAEGGIYLLQKDELLLSVALEDGNIRIDTDPENYTQIRGIISEAEKRILQAVKQIHPHLQTVK